MKKIIYLIPALIGFLASCTQTDFEPATFKRGEKIESTISIAELKTRFNTETGEFTSQQIIANDQLVINGIVTSTDISGNVYKYIAIQEEIPGGEAIRVSVDASGLAAACPLGQRVSIVVNNLNIGKYGESPQVGVFYSRPKDGQVSPGAIPMPIVRDKITLYGQPEPDSVKVDTMTIAQILAAPHSQMDYHLVCIKNAYFTGKGFDYNQPSTISDADKIFAPGTNGVGFPQSREIQDGTGSAAISTSEYAKFAPYPLPASTYTGDITCIVSWYKKGTTAGYQLTLRTLDDLGEGFADYKNQHK
jgi:hypothetical protein